MVTKLSLEKQQGAVLVVVLVMLGIMMIIAATLASTSNINFRIAGNQQFRTEAQLVAQQAIESYISNEANFTVPIPSAALIVPADLNGDGVSEYQAVVEPPSCLRSIPIKLVELEITQPDDVPCYGSGAVQESGFLTEGAASGNSWCAKMMWDVQSTVDDSAVTGANVEIHQGVYLKTLLGTPCP